MLYVTRETDCIKHLSTFYALENYNISFYLKLKSILMLNSSSRVQVFLTGSALRAEPVKNTWTLLAGLAL